VIATSDQTKHARLVLREPRRLPSPRKQEHPKISQRNAVTAWYNELRLIFHSLYIAIGRVSEWIGNWLFFLFAIPLRNFQSPHDWLDKLCGSQLFGELSVEPGNMKSTIWVKAT
jgi:hypothetical protein